MSRFEVRAGSGERLFIDAATAAHAATLANRRWVRFGIDPYPTMVRAVGGSWAEEAKEKAS